jgi:hypothetical protein
MIFDATTGCLQSVSCCCAMLMIVVSASLLSVCLAESDLASLTALLLSRRLSRCHVSPPTSINYSVCIGAAVLRCADHAKRSLQQCCCRCIMSVQRSLAQAVLQSLLQGNTSATFQALRGLRCLVLHDNDNTGELSSSCCTAGHSAELIPKCFYSLLY